MLYSYQIGNGRRRLESKLEFGSAGLFFDCHVFEFTGVEDFAAFLALYKFRIFLARDNPHAGMLADLFYADSLGWMLSRYLMCSAHSPVVLLSGFGRL
jgi:hypothetical protein